MRLSHAIKLVERYSDHPKLSTDERVAMRVLVEMGKRVFDTRSSLRAVVRAVYGEDLNQSDMAELFKKE